MYIYIYIFYKCIYIYIYVYIRISIYIYTYVCICTYIYKCFSCILYICTNVFSLTFRCWHYNTIQARDESPKAEVLPSNPTYPKRQSGIPSLFQVARPGSTCIYIYTLHSIMLKTYVCVYIYIFISIYIYIV